VHWSQVKTFFLCDPLTAAKVSCHQSLHLEHLPQLSCTLGSFLSPYWNLHLTHGSWSSSLPLLASFSCCFLESPFLHLAGAYLFGLGLDIDVFSESFTNFIVSWLVSSGDGGFLRPPLAVDDPWRWGMGISWLKWTGTAPCTSVTSYTAGWETTVDRLRWLEIPSCTSQHTVNCHKFLTKWTDRDDPMNT